MKITSVKNYILAAIATAVAFISCSAAGHGLDPDDCTLVDSKASMFQKAINEFGAVTPDDAAYLWAKGIKREMEPFNLPHP